MPTCSKLTLSLVASPVECAFSSTLSVVHKLLNREIIKPVFDTGSNSFCWPPVTHACTHTSNFSTTTHKKKTLANPAPNKGLLQPSKDTATCCHPLGNSPWPSFLLAQSLFPKGMKEAMLWSWKYHDPYVYQIHVHSHFLYEQTCGLAQHWKFMIPN